MIEIIAKIILSIVLLLLAVYFCMLAILDYRNETVRVSVVIEIVDRTRGNIK